jgi:RNA polymerase sigma factor (sigma-70 family)
LESKDRFEAFIPRFLGALRKLARQGLVPTASDALDTLHDFYLDAWPGVLTRYDAHYGPFDRYAVAAFMRFARTRAARDSSLARRLVPESALETAPSEQSYELELDEARIRAAVEQLQPRHRSVLASIYAERTSERDAARKLGLSRYRLRVHAAEALAAIASQLADPALVSTDETRIARALFVDREPIELAAADHKIPLARAREIRRKLLRRFGQLANSE